MYTKTELEKDLNTLKIDIAEELSVKYVTLKYKRVAKERHPDKGGEKDLFQELQTAYKRVIEYLESKENELIKDEDYEKEFFMKNNFMKECTKSFVVYIQDDMVHYWKIVFQRHLKVYKSNEVGTTIFKTGSVTVTLYDKPKTDPRSKIHVQGKDQAMNLEFIVEKMSLYYQEACTIKYQNVTSVQNVEWSEKVTCCKCGKQYTNKKGLKVHLLRMHAGELPVDAHNKAISISHTSSTSSSQQDSQFTLEESVPEDNHQSQMSDIIIDAVFMEIGKQADSDQISNFQCGDCAAIFKSSNDIHMHVQKEHNEAQNITGNIFDNQQIYQSRQYQDLKVKNELLVKNKNENSFLSAIVIEMSYFVIFRWDTHLSR